MSDLYSSMFLIFEFALFVLQKSLPLLFLWWFLFDPMICRPHVFEVNVWAVFELLLDAILPFLCCSFFGGFVFLTSLELYAVHLPQCYWCSVGWSGCYILHCLRLIRHLHMIFLNAVGSLLDSIFSYLVVSGLCFRVLNF